MSPVPGENRDRPPSDEDHDVENVSGDIIIPADLSGSGSEDDADENYGYMPLPQDYQELDAANSSDEDDSNGDNDYGESPHTAQTEASGSTPGSSMHSSSASYMQVPDLPRPVQRDLLWNQPRPEKAFVMDDDQVAKVKAAMTGFRIPDSSVPGWARSLSEEAWKHQLLSRLQISPGSAGRSVSQPSQSSASATSSESADSGQGQ